MANPSSRWLKSTEWLAGKLGDDKVVVVDGSYYLTTENRNAKEEYLKAHIPGAVFFDINAIADRETDLPHMLPGPDQFGAALGALGVSEKDTIIVYDGKGLYRDHGFEPHHRHELDVVAIRGAEQLDPPQPDDVAVEDAREYLVAQQNVIGIVVVLAGPSAPDPADHVTLRLCSVTWLRSLGISHIVTN